jgi:hypothetical protein
MGGFICGAQGPASSLVPMTLRLALRAALRKSQSSRRADDGHARCLHSTDDLEPIFIGPVRTSHSSDRVQLPAHSSLEARLSRSAASAGESQPAQAGNATPGRPWSRDHGVRKPRRRAGVRPSRLRRSHDAVRHRSGSSRSAGRRPATGAERPARPGCLAGPP